MEADKLTQPKREPHWFPFDCESCNAAFDEQTWHADWSLSGELTWSCPKCGHPNFQDWIKTMEETMNAELATKQKSFIETCIRKDADGNLARDFMDLEADGISTTDVAEVLAQYLYLRHVVQKSLEKVREVGERRFGKESFDKASAEAWAQLGENPEIIRAIQTAPWADPDQPARE